MAERLVVQANPSEKVISRRDFFRKVGNTLAAVAVLNTLRQLPHEISFNAPLLVTEEFTIGGEDEYDNIRFLSELKDRSEADGIMKITPAGKLLYDPSGDFFVPGRKITYAHRAGNSHEGIENAYARGANLLDIDANDVNGTVYGEHGVVPQVKISLGRLGLHLHLPVVVDQNEEQIMLGMPPTYEELLSHIHLLSTVERPIATSTELKRGDFTQNTLNETLAMHKEYNVPVIMHPTGSLKLDIIGDEAASSHGHAG